MYNIYNTFFVKRLQASVIKRTFGELFGTSFINFILYGKGCQILLFISLRKQSRATWRSALPTILVVSAPCLRYMT